MSASTTDPQALVAGWNELIESLRTLPARMLARLPEEQRRNPQIQQEVGRLALEALTSSALGSLGADPDHPTAMPQIGQILNVGQPNADTAYRIVRMSPEGTYRLRGRRGTLRMFNASQSPPSPGDTDFKPGEPGSPRTAHDFSTLPIDSDGCFDVILSRHLPAGHQGPWWKLEAKTNKLLVRMVSADWLHEQPPTLSVERIDKPVARPRVAGSDLESRLRHLPAAIEFIALLFVDRFEQLRAEGYVNQLKMIDMSKIGGLTGQFYYEGTYNLEPDEALILESKLPPKCLYRSLILTNELYETTDWYNNHSSLNDAQSDADRDGVLRAVISAQDPGVPNWLDTAGYARGMIQGRWFDCDEQPLPSMQKVRIAELRRYLPKDTPSVTAEQREHLIRERRAALQQRPLW
ncbi:MAG TPA: hypothetical protein VHZ99_02000 [Steroidobacteraceae bacterium]|jgi:hypothetical protein|nr:hypothetical protein [Steroidobacteraceae bacterium]